MSSDNRKVTVYIRDHVFTDLEAEAARNGLTATDAINQACALWVAMAAAGMIGHPVSIKRSDGKGQVLNAELP